MAKTQILIVCAAILLAMMATSVSAGIHDIKVTDDSRTIFRIETFGFLEGGTIHLKMKEFKKNGVPISSQTKTAFVIKHVESDSSAYNEETDNSCHLYEDESLGAQVIIRPSKAEFDEKRFIHAGSEGFYSIIFVNCEEDHPAISFEMDLELYNPGPNYLSAGLNPLPTVYFVFFLVFVAILCVWLFSVMRGEGKKVYRIHHLMTVLILLKICSLFFKAIEYHFKKTTGHPGGWAIAYYIFATLKGITTFVVIALIGTGWAFIKPYLSEKDKKIFIVVIPLQVISNVAMVLIEEAAPGSPGWYTWKEIFRFVDIVCCIAILAPIVWSIKHLRDAAQIDGKAKKNMEKLKLFRQFYLLVVTYIYFTRIIVYLLDATLSFKYVWLGELFTEAATVIFWCTTGYKFRPIATNPFLELSDDEDGDEDEELQSEEHPDFQKPPPQLPSASSGDHSSGSTPSPIGAIN